MSIPDRFYRIAKHKMVEIKDWFDKVDEEEDTIASERLRTAGERTDARRELADAMEAPPSAPSASPSSRQASTSAVSAPQSGSSAIPVNPPRTNSPSSTYAGTRISKPPAESSSTLSLSSTSAAQSVQEPDPLAIHYKLLGVEAGSDFASVQYAYNKLAARSDASRFPAGSEEEQECRVIRQRLEASYKVLRDALDQTARRFDLLEFDPIPPLSN